MMDLVPPILSGPRRSCRDSVISKRVPDNLPEALPALPPLPSDKEANIEECEILHSPAPQSGVSPEPQQTWAAPIRQVFRTRWNVFGLSRKYVSQQCPSHDPEEHVILSDLVDEDQVTGGSFSEMSTGPVDFHPYPNKSSFLLGDWFWCDGVQKSHESFQNLLNIVGSSDFLPSDVRETNWRQINEALGGNEFDGMEWEDEDAGWSRSPVTISVPIPRQSLKNDAHHVGPQNYTIGHFYHRSLMSVIREKLKNPSDNLHFHYEPYELLWQSSRSQKPSRVHAELYTSSAFLDVHNDLQESPGEPGCILPRVVVALMFWSDSTHLTSFGNAKIWPLYMGFGNESKYRRCKPSLALLNHVAYFEKVRL